MKREQNLLSGRGNLDRKIKRACDGRINLLRIRNPTEINEAGSVLIGVAHLVRQSQRYGRLANSTGPDDRHKAIACKKSDDAGDDFLAAKRRCGLARNAKRT